MLAVIAVVARESIRNSIIGVSLLAISERTAGVKCPRTNAKTNPMKISMPVYVPPDKTRT